jgi:hypothetical protein
MTIRVYQAGALVAREGAAAVYQAGAFVAREGAVTVYQIGAFLAMELTVTRPDYEADAFTTGM